MYLSSGLFIENPLRSPAAAAILHFQVSRTLIPLLTAVVPPIGLCVTIQREEPQQVVGGGRYSIHPIVEYLQQLGGRAAAFYFQALRKVSHV